jgi:hypothetical protein
LQKQIIKFIVGRLSDDYYYARAQELRYRLMSDPEYFEQFRYLDTINVYRRLIEEYQKLYGQTPVTERTARVRIQSGLA